MENGELGLRLPNSTDLEVEQAIADKTIVRTWALRGTLHFVAAADLRWLLALIAPRIIAHNASMYRKLELDERTLARSNAALAKALRGGKQLNRTQLLASLEKSGISTKGLRAVHMLQRASLDALICQTVTVRGNPTYIGFDQLKTRVKMRRSQALAELATRYFASRSPATLQDFRLVVRALARRRTSRVRVNSIAADSKEHRWPNLLAFPHCQNEINSFANRILPSRLR